MTFSTDSETCLSEDGTVAGYTGNVGRVPLALRLESLEGSIMCLLANAFSGRPSDFGGSGRHFGLFLLTTFVVEVTVMAVLNWLLPSRMSSMAGAMLDATLLTLILAPVVWRVFLMPLRRLHKDRGRLLERILLSQEAERARIARDLHDGLGQNLTSMLLHLRAMEETRTIDVAREHMGTLRRIAVASLDDLHRVVRETRPPVLDDLGLAAAVEKQLADMREIGGITTTFMCDVNDIERFSAALETALYRVIQEAVTNTARHSQASHLAVNITKSDDEVLAVITDDGRGFDVTGVLRGEQPPFGLLGMQERVRPLGGSVTFTSAAGRGTVVLVRVPLTLGGRPS
jgi:signal transduction histidine kinase